jgi:hypothetical protein
MSKHAQTYCTTNRHSNLDLKLEFYFIAKCFLYVSHHEFLYSYKGNAMFDLMFNMNSDPHELVTIPSLPDSPWALQTPAIKRLWFSVHLINQSRTYSTHSLHVNLNLNDIQSVQYYKPEGHVPSIQMWTGDCGQSWSVSDHE